MAAPAVMLPVREGGRLGGRYWVGDALQGFAEEAGDFDVVYCDVDKDECPDCWRAVRDRIRVGGLGWCDITIWSGYIATGTDREGLAGFTAFIREHNRLVAEGHPLRGAIIPIRDGVMTALRIE
jgi:caffeoyl-CoA O-methyltransferase